MTPPNLEALLGASRAAIAETPEPGRPFEITVALADGYDDLLSGQYEHTGVSAHELLAIAHAAGRVLLSAPAASGKSSVAGRLARASLESGRPAIRADLRRWSPSFDERWRRARDSDAARMGLLLREIAVPAVEESDLAAAAGVGCVVVADGLNEIPAAASAGVLWVLDAFAARRPFASVLVCDRFQRRPLPSGQWSLATITSVADPQQSGQTSQNALMLDIGGGAEEANEARLLLAHVARAAGDDALQPLAETALGIYRRERSRYFALSDLIAGAGGETASALLSDGLVLRDGEHVYFRHHLFHDALAALAVISGPGDWDSSSFDILTFDANSFDAVGLALELIEDTPGADRLLTAVYNWNQYASAYALSHGRRAGTVAVSDSLELAMLGVLAERRWDPVAPTVQRVEDALRVFPGEFPKRLLGARNLREIHALIRERATALVEPPAWLTVFLGAAPPAQLVLALGGEALTGWMAANSLRDAPLTGEDLARVVAAMDHPQRDIRWRAAHALGAHPGKATAERLLGAIDRDEDKWVRYGAIRSLIEQAGRAGPKLRSWILRSVQRRAGLIRHDSLVRGELERALQLRCPPIGWASAVEPLLMELFATSLTVPDQDHWRRVGHRVTESVRAARAGVASASRSPHRTPPASIGRSLPRRRGRCASEPACMARLGSAPRSSRRRTTSTAAATSSTSSAHTTSTPRSTR